MKWRLIATGAYVSSMETESHYELLLVVAVVHLTHPLNSI